MIISNFPHGSPEWHLERAGCITASMFHLVRASAKVDGLNAQQTIYVRALLDGKPLEAAKGIAGYKSAPTAKAIEKALDLKTTDVGEYSDKALDYAFRLACERIAGVPLDDQFETYAMRRGRELEEDCRLLHEKALGEAVELATFLKTEDGKFGCTPDSLCSDDGGAEYKCFYAADKVRPILLDNKWHDTLDQVQGCIAISGRAWWDICLYFPALKSIDKDFRRIRVERDEAFIEKLWTDLLAFDKLVCENEAKIRAA